MFATTRTLTQRERKVELSLQTPSTHAALQSTSLKILRLLVAVRTAANLAIIIAWSRVCDDVGLINQVCALKTVGGQFDFRLRAPLNIYLCEILHNNDLIQNHVSY